MKSIDDQFPAQFDGPYYLGTSIFDGWLPIVTEACQRIQDVLTPEEMERFSWAQIKEKFGGLQMYWHSNRIPVSAIHPEGVSNFEVKVGRDDEVLDRIQAKVAPIIADAQRRAAKTCEICGGPGYLRPGGYWQTLCDRHAAEEGKELPPFGVALHSRQAGRKHHEGQEIVSNAGAALRDQAFRIWQVGEKEMVFVKDLLPAMVDQVFATTGRPVQEMIEFHELVDNLRARPDGVPTILNGWLQHPGGAKLNIAGRAVATIETYRDDDRHFVSHIRVLQLPGRGFLYASIRVAGSSQILYRIPIDPDGSPKSDDVSETRADTFGFRDLVDEYRRIVDDLVSVAESFGVDRSTFDVIDLTECGKCK